MAWLAALCLLLLPSFANAQEKARIYVYSLRESAAPSRLSISFDGTPVAKLKHGTFFAVDASAGRHVISSSKGVPLFVDLKPGGEAFVRLGMEAEVGEPSTVVFDNVPPRAAAQEMRFVVYIDSKDAFSASIPKADPRPTPDKHFKKREQFSE